MSEMREVENSMIAYKTKMDRERETLTDELKEERIRHEQVRNTIRQM